MALAQGFPASPAQASSGTAAKVAAVVVAASIAAAGYGYLQHAMDEWTLCRADRIVARRKAAEKERALMRRRAWLAGATVVAGGLCFLWLRSEWRRWREADAAMAAAARGVAARQ
jgi:hypothetical protein